MTLPAMYPDWRKFAFELADKMSIACDVDNVKSETMSWLNTHDFVFIRSGVLSARVAKNKSLPNYQ